VRHSRRLSARRALAELSPASRRVPVTLGFLQSCPEPAGTRSSRRQRHA
jgi:hypothetical protein